VKLAFEKEMLGIYVSDHPLREIAESIRDAADHSLAELEELSDGTFAWFAGILTDVETRPTKRGTMMAVATIEDMEGSAEAVLFPQTYDAHRDLVTEDTVLRIKAKVETSDRGRKLLVQEVQPFDGSVFSKPAGKVIVETEHAALKNGRLDKLKSIIEHYQGRDTLELHVASNDKTEVYKAGRVDRRSHGLHAELLELFGAGSVREAV
jgi:DNA polymerase-3 subunit alpha